MSEQWDKQKDKLDWHRGVTVWGMFGGKQGSKRQKELSKSGFVQDIAGRANTTANRARQETTNREKRGNPLTIIANEEKPNPARRIRMIGAVRNNQ